MANTPLFEIGFEGLGDTIFEKVAESALTPLARGPVGQPCLKAAMVRRLEPSAPMFLKTWFPAYAKRPLTKVPLKNARVACATRTIVKIGSESLPGESHLEFKAGRSFFGAREFSLISSQRCASFFPARPPGPGGRSRLAAPAEREFFEKSLPV